MRFPGDIWFHYSDMFAFDTIMSLEAHWFSTMFGWYNFAALWVSGLAVMTLNHLSA
jgi:hypothetical protein